MASIYKHGTYGEVAASVVSQATQSGTIAVYVGTAPVNLVRDYANAVNAPVLIASLSEAYAKIGYSADWGTFTLCEAIKAHFGNPLGNAGPIVVINVLNPRVHKKSAETTAKLNFVNGRATIKSDTIILDTLVLADKVENVDFTMEYDFSTGTVILTSIGDTEITGTVSATYTEIDASAIDEDTIIGGATEGGTYEGIGAVQLVYQELNLIPNLLVAPAWSEKPTVYAAMVAASQNINGHWNAFVLADIPILDGSTKVDNISAAKSWKEKNGYSSEWSKVCWPQFVGTDGNIYHASTLTAWRMQAVDAENDGIPMETPSNKAIPVARQYFGTGSLNRGFDQARANDLNAAGITTGVFFGGKWVLWGGHTAAYKNGGTADPRATFDNNVRMMMYILNSFQQDWADTIDQPMTVAMADTIRQREQEKADALVAVGALIGSPVVVFNADDNGTDAISNGDFSWRFEATPTPQAKSMTLKVSYSDAGFSVYFGEEG